MKKTACIIVSCTLAVTVLCGAGLLAPFNGLRSEAAVYNENEYMKNLTLPTQTQYVEKDWKKTTTDYLEYVFDENNRYKTDTVDMKIARYTPARNAKEYFASIGKAEEAPSEIWSLPTYLGKGNDTEAGEGLTALGAIMSGALVGMDLTDYECSDGTHRNFVKSAVEYYSFSNGEHVVLNDIGSKTGNTFWYELLPGVLFAVLGTQYPSEGYYMYDIVTESARQWYKAVVGLGGANADFWHTSYKFETGQPFDGNWNEPDAAAGMAYILYAAYSLNANLKKEGKSAYATDEEIAQFLQGAEWSMNYLERLDRSPFYEVLTFLAPYVAARMNAEQGKNYDVAKMVSWLMDGSSAVRSGWGLVTENWGDKYTNGLMGSLTDGDGYAFAMNTFDAMLGFAPMVKYDTRFARDISRWVLCASQSARNYYPSEYTLDGEYGDAGGGNTHFWYGYEQSGKDIDPDSEEATFIAYEGLRRYRRYVVWENGTRTTKWDRDRTPYASGDAFTFDWGGLTDYGLYGSSHVGLFGSTIAYTDVPMILRTDLSKLDVYGSGTIPFYMYYNPYTEEKEVSVTLPAGKKLYDTVEKRDVPVKNGKIAIGADQTLVLAEIPADAAVKKEGSVYTCNGEFIAEDRGYVTLSVYQDAGCTQKIKAGAAVEGTVYAKLGMEVPEGAEVQSLVLEHGGISLYSGTAAPQEAIAVDTTLLKNGSGTMTAVLTLKGGAVEKASLLLQVLNVVKTPALEYDSFADLADTWNGETQEWQAQYPNSDHTSGVTAEADGFTVTVRSPKGYGFATSELFPIDLSRGPMLEFTVSKVTKKYSIKIYVEGMDVHNNYTGAYVVRDTDETGHFSIDIVEAIKQEDRTFDLTGAHRASIKISPAEGAEGDSVTFTQLEVYHLYTTPVLDEPETYEWGHDFKSEWLSLWSGSTAGGGVGNAKLTYTMNGSVRVEATEGSDRSGVASPYIAADLSMNPVLDVSLLDLRGNYFVAVRFEGSDSLYVLADGKSDGGGTIEILPALKARYADEYDSFTGAVRMRIVIGVEGTGAAEFSDVKTYYKLPGWGLSIRGEDWLDWEPEDAKAGAEYDLSSSRYVIRNTSDPSNETSVTGVRGKFSLNLDYNPEAVVRVRSVSGGATYRFALTTFDGTLKYPLTDWMSARGEATVNVRTALDGALRGAQNIWFFIEVRGGGHMIEVDRMTTRYTAVQPDFETGATLTEEIASWKQDETNPSKVAVKDGAVVISENYLDSRGLYTAELTVSADARPYIVVDIASLSEGAAWYLNAAVGGKTYALVGEKGSAATGETVIDLISALANAGYKAEGSVTAVYELGGTGASFEVAVSSVRFVRRLAAPAGLTFRESENKAVWEGVTGAEGYTVRVEDASGAVLREEETYTATSFDVGALGLSQGVYRIYLAAYAGSMLTSEEVRLAFKQGDIESVVLGTPQDFENDGMTVRWKAIPDIDSYHVVLTDADEGTTLFEGEIAQNELDLTEYGFAAFNFKLSVQAKGDGAVYLDGERAEYAFYTNIKENYGASKFASMGANANQAYAEYDEANDVAVLRIPYTNWGSIASLATALNFDRSPVLMVRFAAGCQGGYYMQILIDGVAYYLADNTFTIHGNTAPIDLYLDLCGILGSRTDGPSSPVTGTHNVAIVFGATSDGFPGVDTPVVRIAYAQLVEMTPGSGAKKLGTLATPAVSVNGKTASWQAVANAESYTVVISNELGILLSTTVTETAFDLSMLLREGEYTIQVTATAANYFSSDTGSAVFTVREEGTGTETDGGCSSSVGGAAYALLGAIVCASVLLTVKKRRDR